MRHQIIRRGATAPFSLLLLALMCYGGISVVGLFREKTGRRGEIYRDEITIINRSTNVEEVTITKKNLLMTVDGIKFQAPANEKYSLASWMKLDFERFRIEPSSKVVIKYQISVPEDIESATYHLLLLVKGRSIQIETAKVGVGIAVQHAMQILYHIPGGKKDAEIFNVEMGDDDILSVDVRNTGNYWMPLKISSDLLGEKQINIYNGQERRVSFDCSGLADRFYKDVRVILDDGNKFLKAEFISFRKGEEPKEIPLSKVRSEMLTKRRRAGKPYSLFANLNYGNRRRGLSLTGTLRIWDFSLSAGSTHSEYQYGDVISDFGSQRLSINFRKEWFSLGMGNSWYNGQWMSTMRVGVNFRRIQANMNYSVKYKILSANVSQRLRLFKKNFIFRLSGFKSENREDWNLSLMIPIL